MRPVLGAILGLMRLEFLSLPCGGEIKIIAAILKAPVIEPIPSYLGLQARASPRALARGGFEQAA